MANNILPVVSSRSFLVSGFTFKSLTHFELILYMVSESSSV